MQRHIQTKISKHYYSLYGTKIQISRQNNKPYSHCPQLPRSSWVVRAKLVQFMVFHVAEKQRMSMYMGRFLLLFHILFHKKEHC